MGTIIGLITAVLVLAFARLVYNHIQLRKVPGPLLAGCTNLWRAYLQYNGGLRAELLHLHEVHGPIVRYGVNMVSIADPAAVSQIYLGKGFMIHDSYRVLLGIKDGKEVESLVSTRDETKHGQMRRSVANAFTPTAALEMEALIENAITTLLQVLLERPRIDIANVMFLYSLDSAGETAFSEDIGCLKADADVQGLGSMIRARFEHWGTWAAIPELERLIFRNPITMRLPQGQPASFATTAAQKYRSRLSSEKDWGSKDLLQKFVEAGKKYPEFLDARSTMGMIMSTISGAADTTSTTMLGIIYFLLMNPPVRERLEKELDDAQVTVPIPRYTEVRHLPYLDAVIKESMRLFTVINWPMERKVPAGGMKFKEYFFPEGTSVGVLPAALHMDRSVFGEDVKVFRPERWLEGDAEGVRRMEASFLGFSRGKRVCLGQNIAILQLKKVIPALFLSYNIALADDKQFLNADCSPAVVMVKPLHVTVSPKAVINHS